MIIINYPEIQYTYKEGERTGIPDFTIGGENILNLISSWKVNENTYSHSDHLASKREFNV